jgi:hypothetical protein
MKDSVPAISGTGFVQELYSSLIQPIEVTKSILQSKQLADSKYFKIEFSGTVFVTKFLEETSEFVSEKGVPSKHFSEIELSFHTVSKCLSSFAQTYLLRLFSQRYIKV